jgi:hypothetical protein
LVVADVAPPPPPPPMTFLVISPEALTLIREVVSLTKRREKVAVE